MPLKVGKEIAALERMTVSELRERYARDVVKETDVRPIASTLDWRKQRRLWITVCQGVSSRPEVAST